MARLSYNKTLALTMIASNTAFALDFGEVEAVW